VIELPMGNALIESIRSTDISDLLVDAAEFSLDQFLQNETLKDIPIIGSIAKIYGGINDIRQLVFLRKVSFFLFEFQKVSAKEKDRFIKKIVKDNGTSQKVGETVITLLDRLDHQDKAKFAGRLFVAYAKNEIDNNQLFRALHIIDKMYIGDIRAIKKVKDHLRFTSEELNSFQSVGLQEVSIVQTRRPKLGRLGETEVDRIKIEEKTSFTEYFWLIANILFDVETPTMRISRHIKESSEQKDSDVE
jgi:hypothetical protein